MPYHLQGTSKAHALGLRHHRASERAPDQAAASLAPSDEAAAAAEREEQRTQASMHGAVQRMHSALSGGIMRSHGGGAVAVKPGAQAEAV